MTAIGTFTERGCAGAFISACLFGMPAVAVAQDRDTRLDVTVSGEMNTNPYNSTTSSGAVGAATLELRPYMIERSGTGTFELTGFARFRQFSKRFGLEDSYGASMRGISRPSERLTVRGEARVGYSVTGYGSVAANTALPTIGGPTTGVPLPEPLPGFEDVTVLGLQNRSTSIDGQVGMDYRLSDRSTITADATGNMMRFKSGVLGDYAATSQSLSYQNTLSEVFTVSAAAGLGQTDYRGRRSGDTRSFYGMGEVQAKIGARWILSGGAGATVTHVRQLAGQPNIKLTSFTMRGQACYKGNQNRFCVNVRQSPQPTAVGGVRLARAIGLLYHRELSDKDRIGLTGGLSRTAQSVITPGTTGTINFYNAGARYERTIHRNLSLFAAASVSDYKQRGFAVRANYGLSAGLRIQLGARA